MRIVEISKPAFMLLFALLVPIAVFAGSARAEKGYVSDMLIVGVRAGQGKEDKVIGHLRTNTPVEVLEEENGYFKVCTEGGDEGWVAKQYISFETPKPLVIAGLKKKIADLEKKIADLEARIEEFEKRRASLQDELEVAKQNHAIRVKELEKGIKESEEEALRKKEELRQITNKYNALVDRSKNVVELVEKNDKLGKAKDKLSMETERLQEENTRLARAGNFRWFLGGGGVFFTGLIIGKLSRKKKYY